MNLLIITLPLHTNYGGILQNFALCKALTNNGYNIKSIRWSSKKFKLPFYRKPFVYFKRVIRHKEIKYEERMKVEYPIISAELNRFIQQYIPFTEKTFDCEAKLRAYIQEKNIDVIIYGSDQIWRKTYGDTSLFNKFFPQQKIPNLRTFFGNFLKDDINIKQISYAASFGVDYAEYNKKEQIDISKLLQKFSAISVREDSGINIINDIYKWKISVDKVLDPTLLLTREEYLNIINSSRTQKSDSEIYFYLLDKTANNDILRTAIETKLKFKTHSIILDDKNISKPLKQRILPSIEQWLRNISDAKFVITDSFHGMVFCIIFNTPFCVLSNEKRGNTRFSSLLNILGLESRLCSTQTEIFQKITEPINWIKVNKKLVEERNLSLSFLLKHLN